MADDEFPPISDLALLSDCRSLTLVGRDASIEWACFPRFDASPVFARILDRALGGYFRIAPSAPARSTRHYVDESNVLETRFTTDDGGVLTVTDFLPVYEDPAHPQHLGRRPPEHLLVRVVSCEEGSVDVSLECRARFDYGLTTPYAHARDDDLALVVGSADGLVLQSELGPLECDDGGGVTARTALRTGERAYVALTWGPSTSIVPERLERADLESRLDETLRFWGSWAAHCTYDGPYRDAVVRSALALKGLTASATGAVIAAATTSLPEEIGGVRNWDYRFTWLRDSVALLVALARLGYVDEARHFATWMLRTSAGRADELQIMYGLAGERLLHEVELDHLSGYRDSRPVRVGNGAWDQFQLDTYGELVAATWLVRTVFPVVRNPQEELAVGFLRDVCDHVCDVWEQPDEGIWEVRGERQDFTFSKLMAWVALERGSDLARRQEHHDVPRIRRWEETRDRIRARIETEAVDPDTNAFVQAFGSKHLDASTLQIPIQGFVPYDDPRVLATVDEIDARLARDGHVYRYLGDGDGLPGGEGSFVICSFWLVAVMAGSGQLERAEERFRHLLSYANDVGLLAEEIDPDTGEQLGNFPQALSHIGLIAAALAIESARHGGALPFLGQ